MLKLIHHVPCWSLQLLQLFQILWCCSGNHMKRIWNRQNWRRRKLRKRLKWRRPKELILQKRVWNSWWVISFYLHGKFKARHTAEVHLYILWVTTKWHCCLEWLNPLSSTGAMLSLRRWCKWGRFTPRNVQMQNRVKALPVQVWENAIQCMIMVRHNLSKQN